MLFVFKVNFSDARALVDVGNVGANIVAQKFQEMSPSSIARRGLSKLSDIFSPLPSRKSISVRNFCFEIAAEYDSLK